MEFIEEWMHTTHDELKHYTDSQKNVLVNSILDEYKMTNSSYHVNEGEDIFASENEEDDSYLHSYDNLSAVKRATTSPLKDSSMSLNTTDKPGSYHGTGMNLRKTLHKQKGYKIRSPGDVQNHAPDLQLMERFRTLNIYQGKENGGDENSFKNHHEIKNHQKERGNEGILDHSCKSSADESLYEADISMCSNELSTQIRETSQLEDQGSEEGSILLNKLPIFQNKPIPNSGGSLSIGPELLNSNDGEIKYFESINGIDDETYLPHHFQNHKLSKSSLNNEDESYEYFKNKNCPPSRETENRYNYSHHRYSRILKVLKPPYREGQFDVLCRFCRGKNWVKKIDYNDHLALSHGILVVDYSTPAALLPDPKSLMIQRERSFLNFHVSCPICSQWVRLGNSSYENSVDLQPRTQGLYFRYFVHYLMEHEKDFDCESERNHV